MDTMPQPQIVDYEKYFKISELFKTNLNAALKNMPVEEVSDIIKIVENCNDVLPLAVMNETVQRISKMPYKYVKTFMRVIETNQSLYFSPAAKPEEKK